MNPSSGAQLAFSPATASFDEFVALSAETLAGFGVNVAAVRAAAAELTARPEEMMSALVNFVVMERLVRKLVEQTTRDLPEESVLVERAMRGRPPALRAATAAAVAQSVAGLRGFAGLVAHTTPVNVPGTALVVQSFARGVESGSISLPVPGTAFNAELFHLVYPSAREHVSASLRAVPEWLARPSSIPEYSFVFETLFAQVSSVYQSAALARARSNDDFLKDVLDTVGGKEGAQPSSDVSGVLGVIDGAYSAVTCVFSDGDLDREVLVKALLLAMMPLVRAAASGPPEDAALWEAYSKILAAPIFSLSAADRLALKDELCISSPIFARAYAFFGQHLGSLLELTKTGHLIEGF